MACDHANHGQYLRTPSHCRPVPFFRSYGYRGHTGDALNRGGNEATECGMRLPGYTIRRLCSGMEVCVA